MHGSVSETSREGQRFLDDRNIGEGQENNFVMRGHSIAQNGLSFTPLLRASVKQ
jgi:sortase (surface protein transpeptidase)